MCTYSNPPFKLEVPSKLATLLPFKERELSLELNTKERTKNQKVCWKFVLPQLFAHNWIFPLKSIAIMLRPPPLPLLSKSKKSLPVELLLVLATIAKVYKMLKFGESKKSPDPSKLMTVFPSRVIEPKDGFLLQYLEPHGFHFHFCPTID